MCKMEILNIIEQDTELILNGEKQSQELNTPQQSLGEICLGTLRAIVLLISQIQLRQLNGPHFVEHMGTQK